MVALSTLLIVMVAVGCKVQGRVDVSVYDDGSGSVTVAVGLDAEALQQLGDPATALKVDDLKASGWSVDPPSTEGKRTWFRATKPFRSPNDLGPLMEEIGVFRNWSLEVADGFGTTTWKLDGVITERTGLEQFSDEKLAAALDGKPLGMSPEELQAQRAKSGPVPLDVSVHLPGDTDDRTVFTVDLAAASPERRVSVTSERSAGAPTRWIVVGGLFLAGAALLVVLGQLSVTRRRYRRSR